MISSNEIRKDDFTLILPNHYFVKLDLVIPKTINDQGSIEFRIIFINSNGIEEKPCEQPEIKMIPVPATIFMSTYTKLVETIISRDNDLSQTIIIGRRPRNPESRARAGVTPRLPRAANRRRFLHVHPTRLP